ncbi:polyprenyl synthetase family protein [Bdellovibrionota bacterium FG-2]
MDFENLLENQLERILNDSPQNLTQAIRYSLLAPGKRIRPRLVHASAKLLGLPEQASNPIALAIEMFHCFTLIHDDLPCMDDDDFRRGKPSNHKVFGEAIALLAGDSLMALAAETLLEAHSFVKNEPFMKGMRRFLEVAGPRGVMGGQAQESLLHADSPLSRLRLMHQKKTGVLFSASVLIPKDFTGIEDASSQGQALIVFSAALGEAFQVADDLEDLLSTPLKELQDSSIHILHYLTAEDARTQTLIRLDAAMEGLSKIYGEQAHELIAVGKEVRNKL